MPLLSAARSDTPRPAPSLVIRSGAVGLGLSSALMAVCSLLHFSDERWLAVSQRGSVHVSSPGGVLGFAKPAVGVINSVANLPVEWRATQVAVHTAIICAFLTLAAMVLDNFSPGGRPAGRRSDRSCGRKSGARPSAPPLTRLRRRHHVGVPVDEGGVVAAEGEQLLVGAALGDLPVVEDEDLVRVADGREPVRDRDRGAARADGVDGLLDGLLGLRVEGAGGLVEDEDRRVADTARAIARRCFSPPENR